MTCPCLRKRGGWRPIIGGVRKPTRQKSGEAHSQAISTEHNVGEATVHQLGDAGLLAEIKGNVAHIRLDLSQSQLRGVTK